MIKVGIVTHNLYAGSMANVASRYAASLQSTGGFEVELVCFAGDINPELIPDGVTVQHLRTNHVRRSFRRLIRYLRNRHPDVVISFPTFVSLMVLSAGLAARLLKAWNGALVPVMTHPLAQAHVASWKDNKWGARALYRHADAWLAHSPRTAQEAISWARVDASRTQVIPPPLRPHDLRDLPVKVRRSTSDAFFLTLSRVVALKRHDVLLDSFERYVAMGGKAKLVVAGAGPDLERVSRMAQAQALRGRVEVVGLVKDPLELMAQARAFVLTSDEEGFGQVLLEAMAVGCPVITTDAIGGGPRFITEDGKYGVLVPRRDVIRFSMAMKAMDVSSERRRWSSLSTERSISLGIETLGPQLAAFVEEVALLRSRGSLDAGD